ncbi:hypothetical protein [Rugosimonospora africana]|uniref:Lipoprotein n=1 Tax=Rugosimonospora africana TaxID=556532 RepID=A0A8J3QYZ5_9ACTN|nr:hypothetical protein [Rugosimonospora africana]GIH19864.1 hypothetical protein Raf01_80360 [Rugosimonospora africana]
MPQVVRSSNFAAGVVAVVAGVALVGCGDSKPSADHSSPADSGKAGGATASVPAYTGSPLPGLDAKPVAAVPAHTGGSGEDDTPYAVGTSFVFVKATDPKSTGDQQRPATVVFYQASTGRQLARVEVPLWDEQQPQVGDFNGQPAIYFHETTTGASDGLNPPQTTDHELGFVASGKKVVDESWPDAQSRKPVDGWPVNATTSKVSIYAPDGTLRLSVDVGDVNAYPQLPTIVDNVALVSEAEPGSSEPQSRLAAYDLTNPRSTLWTSDTVKPAGATSPNPSVRFTTAGRLVLVWSAGSDPDKAIVSVNDLHTGKALGVTASLTVSHDFWSSSGSARGADNAQANTAVLPILPADSDLGCIALSEADAQIRWQQTATQEGFTPILVVGDAVYGSTRLNSVNAYVNGDNSLPLPTLALSLTTGTVAQNGFDTAVPFLVTDDGYALVYPADSNANHYWIFKSNT